MSWRNCEFCGYHTNALMRACCALGRDADQVEANERRDRAGAVERLRELEEGRRHVVGSTTREPAKVRS